MNARANNCAAFTEQLTSLILKEQRNTNFRYEVLRLIKRYYGINKLSFLLFDENTSFNKNYREALLDNVTLGLDEKAVEEYYNQFYLIDPLHNTINTDRLENMTQDYLSIEDFYNTKFYQKFYKKYDSFYIFSRGLIFEDRVIGVLTFIKDKDEGDFSKKQKNELLLITNIINNELSKIIIYERLSIQNKTLKESEKYFPVAKIVMDYDYNVIYNNDLAKKYIKEITGSEDTKSFKFFVINEMVTQGMLTPDKRGVFLSYDEFTFAVAKDFSLYSSEHTAEYYYNMFILKSPVTENVDETESLDLTILTQREKEVAKLISEGMTNDQIAEEFVISPFTVKTHVQRIYSKLNVSSRAELLYLLIENSR